MPYDVRTTVDANGEQHEGVGLPRNRIQLHREQQRAESNICE